MKLERDSIPLDKEFPFQISEVELNLANSRPGTWHWHSYFEITWVLEGKGNYFVNGQEYTMEKDDIIIFKNGKLDNLYFNKGLTRKEAKKK